MNEGIFSQLLNMISIMWRCLTKNLRLKWRYAYMYVYDMYVYKNSLLKSDCILSPISPFGALLYAEEQTHSIW